MISDRDNYPDRVLPLEQADTARHLCYSWGVVDIKSVLIRLCAV